MPFVELLSGEAPLEGADVDEEAPGASVLPHADNVTKAATLAYR